jgi:tRNA dimethylallyltransferase
MGPTASGKTRLAIELVQNFPCEIVSVDSAMVYRGMDIGTAKPTLQERIAAPHRLIDLCDPKDSYSAGRFCKDAAREIADIHAQNKIPLLTGGTMLYFHVLQHGIANLPEASPAIREEINERANKIGWNALYQELQKLDPESAARIKPSDAQRIQRALEIFYVTEQPLSALQKKMQKSDYTFFNIIMAPLDRHILHKRIIERFEIMLKQGFVEEVEQLFQRGDLHANLPSIRTVGYRQIWAYLQGECNFSEMKEKAIIATRQFAKRQFTWLRRWQDVSWLDSESKQLYKQVSTVIPSLEFF